MPLRDIIPQDPQPIGELMRRVVAVPKDQVVPTIGKIWDVLPAIDDNDLYLRHWVVLAALVNRAAVEIYEIPMALSVVI